MRFRPAISSTRRRSASSVCMRPSISWANCSLACIRSALTSWSSYGAVLDHPLQILVIAGQLLFGTDDVVGDAQAHDNGQGQQTKVAEQHKLDHAGLDKEVKDKGGHKEQQAQPQGLGFPLLSTAVLPQTSIEQKADGQKLGEQKDDLPHALGRLQEGDLLSPGQR